MSDDTTFRSGPAQSAAAGAFVPFDEVWPRIRNVLEKGSGLPPYLRPVYLVRDLSGRVRISVPECFDTSEYGGMLAGFARRLHEKLGAYGYPPETALLHVGEKLLRTLEATGKPFEGFPEIFRVERLITGDDWWTVSAGGGIGTRRCTLYSVKGGVGRSTTVAFLARTLAGLGERILVLDLDLESPGLSPTLLEPERRATFGVTDWFAESRVGQGDCALDDMLAEPAWAQECEGGVFVAAAHGANPGEYLAKLGRVYMQSEDARWTQRLQDLVGRLEARVAPTITLIESRSGLHDIAAATVTDLNAEVLLFATGTESTWLDYDILFRHWNAQELGRRIRERLAIVAALTPEDGREACMDRLRLRAWDLFRDHLYDSVAGVEAGVDASPPDVDDAYSFDLNDPDAPHAPLEINWARGLATGAPVRSLDDSVLLSAYDRFLRPFVERVLARSDGNGT